MEGGAEPADMTERERELLAYLEDLQQNNPAEYELLVKDLQEKAAAEGKGPAAAQNQGEQVTPLPGFVAKTRSATHKGRKVFINVCQSDHVDKPAPVEGADDSEEVQMRIPMSLGPPREDLDKSGEVCTVYDVVFNPEAVEMALREEEMRQFMMNIAVYQIQQKCKDEVSTDMTFPKVKGNYKGIAPMPQIMRKKGVPPPPVPGSKAEKEKLEKEAAEKAAATSSKIEEMEGPRVESLPAPSYAVEPRSVLPGGELVPLKGACAVGGTGSLGEPDVGASEGVIVEAPSPGPPSSADANALSIKVHLPAVEDESAIKLELSTEQLELLIPGTCALSVQLPQAVCLPPLSATFETKRRILSILVRTDTGGGLNGGLGEDEPAASASAASTGGASSSSSSASGTMGESESARREREREARLNARRKRAAGNKQLKRQADAEAQVEAGLEEGGGDGDGGAAHAAAGQLEEVQPDAAAVARERAAKEEAKKVDEGFLELSNSIMFELEELYGV